MPIRGLERTFLYHFQALPSNTYPYHRSLKLSGYIDRNISKHIRISIYMENFERSVASWTKPLANEKSEMDEKPLGNGNGRAT